jgi:multidrug efflux pump subunit AcrB
MLQGDAPFRMLPEDVNRWYVRNAQGGMVPFSAFATARWTLGSPKLERFNGAPSVSLLGEPTPGHSSGEAIREVERMARDLPAGIGVALRNCCAVHAWVGWHVAATCTTRRDARCTKKNA